MDNQVIQINPLELFYLEPELSLDLSRAGFCWRWKHGDKQYFRVVTIEDSEVCR